MLVTLFGNISSVKPLHYRNFPFHYYLFLEFSVVFNISKLYV